MNAERILVVDDNPEMLQTLGRLVLPIEGYEVDTAQDGYEALEKVAKNAPDLIITDMAMPRMTGLEMAESLQQQGYRIPIILVTAEGSEKIAVRALRAGVMDYFIKPFDTDDLLAAIRRVLAATRVGQVQVGVPDQNRLEAINTLIQIGKSVTSLLDLEKILSHVVEAATQLTKAEEGTLMLVDKESGELYVRASKNLMEGQQNMRLRVNNSLAGQVISTGEPLVIGGEGELKIKTAYLVQSLLYVPLKANSEVIGVLGVHNRARPQPISSEAVGLMASLADYAAIGITNAQSYTQSEHEKRRLARIIEYVKAPIYLLDRETRLIMANPSGLALLRDVDESGADSLTGKALAGLFHNQALSEQIERAQRLKASGGELSIGDGRTFSTMLNDVPGIGYVVVMHDITHLKQLDRIKSEFVTTVSHDLRSPLTSILSYVELMSRFGPLNERQQEFAARVRTSVEAITALINDLLELSHIEAGLDRERVPLKLSSILRRVIESLQSRADLKNQTVTFNPGSEEIEVLGNSIRLRQVFANLIDNAIKYTPDQGKVEITLMAEGGQAICRVKDTGIGIPIADQPHIFDKFYRSPAVSTDYLGTGLGLNIVKTIVESHDGRVWVDSSPEGSVFTVVLPGYTVPGSSRSSDTARPTA